MSSVNEGGRDGSDWARYRARPMHARAHELLSAGLTAAQLAEALDVPLAHANAWRDELVEHRRGSRRRGRRLAFGGAAVLLTLLAGGQAFSVGTCSQTLPFGLVTFCADEPALTSEVNGNVDLLAAWINAKVGPRSSATLTTTRIEGSSALVVNSTDSDRALWVQ